MLVRLSRLSACLLAFLFTGAALHADVSLDSLLPVEGTVGTPLDVQLMGDIGKGKPKLWFTLADDDSKKPRKTKLKVTEVTDMGGSLFCLATSFKKTKTGAGVYDLHVKPKGKGLIEQVFPAAFTMRDPSVDEADPDSANSKDVIEITGEFFGGGPAKPRVLLVPTTGGKIKKAKVQELTDGASLMVKLPKLSDGIYDVAVITKVGLGLLEAGLSIVNIGGGGGGSFKDHLSMTLASVEQTLLTTQYEAKGPNHGGSVLFAINQSMPGFPITIITSKMIFGIDKGIGISLGFPFEPGVTPTPFTFQMGQTSPQFNIVVSQDMPDADWWTGGALMVPGSVTVNSATKKRIKGSFQFTLVPATPSPAAGNLVIQSADFDIGLTVF